MELPGLPGYRRFPDHPASQVMATEHLGTAGMRHPDNPGRRVVDGFDESQRFGRALEL